ncbi:hypothetical protein FRB95_006483 [Tulasnella sp. JGI-2019a]|nr:hypothetical protein FRB95_006483 [Tulasnella sp. JGI-2019a]
MDYSSYSKDPDYYFPDGSLCLAVEQKLFKIHSGVLARHSTVFCDMLSVPPLADTGGEQYEAVPVVRLEDEAKDIWVLLSVTYDPPCDSVLTRRKLHST